MDDLGLKLADQAPQADYRDRIRIRRLMLSPSARHARETA
jgi:hypothetical protein